MQIKLSNLRGLSGTGRLVKVKVPAPGEWVTVVCRAEGARDGIVSWGADPSYVEGASGPEALARVLTHGGGWVDGDWVPLVDEG